MKWVIAIYAGLLLLYGAVLHPWLAGWGATAAEQRMSLPGDTEGPYFTRAITIAAPPERVWPWLLQLGQDRGGFYSNDWLENLIGLDMHNADTLHAEWQHRAIGDIVRLVPPRYLGAHLEQFGPRISLLQPPLVIADSPARFVLLPIDPQTTRLYLREGVKPNTPPGGVLGEAIGRLVWDPMHFVMEQRMLRGIKERAEGRPLLGVGVRRAARLGWAIAVIAVGVALWTRPRGYLLLLPPVAAAIPALDVASDLQAAVAAFVAVGAMIALSWFRYVRWFVAAGVALTLLLAPDAFAAFGVMFDLLALSALLSQWQLQRRHTPRPIRAVV